MIRLSQIYEMFVAGYEFYVLNNVFLTHWGFQTKEMRPQWRSSQRSENEDKFGSFARDIFFKYHKDPCQMIPQILFQREVKNIVCLN